MVREVHAIFLVVFHSSSGSCFAVAENVLFGKIFKVPKTVVVGVTLYRRRPEVTAEGEGPRKDQRYPRQNQGQRGPATIETAIAAFIRICHFSSNISMTLPTDGKGFYRKKRFSGCCLISTRMFSRSLECCQFDGIQFWFRFHEKMRSDTACC